MVKVDKETCIGCGLCTSLCEQVFELSSDGKAQVKKGANSNARCIKEAIDSCPVNAISG